MIKKKVSPIIARADENARGRVVGFCVEYRLFGLLLYSKVIYTPDRYDNVRWNETYVGEKMLTQSMLNQ